MHSSPQSGRDFLSLLLCFIPLFAPVLAQDSVRYRFPPVTVERPAFQIPGITPQYTISTVAIAQLAPTRLHTLLSFAPGVFIRDYGGFGGLKTISLRGSGAAQTSIYLEGFPLNALQNGIIDLGTLPASIFQRVAFYKSAVLPEDIGANIGGSVHLFLPSTQPLSAIVEVGSFGYRQMTLAGNLNAQTFLVSNFLQSRGNYPFFFTNFGKRTLIRRQNSDIQSWNLLFSHRHTTSHFFLKNLNFFSYTHRGVPGAVVQGAIENRRARLRQWDFWTALAAGISTRLAMVETQALFRALQTGFSDPAMTVFGKTGFRSRYLETQTLLQTRFWWRFYPGWRLIGNLALSSAQLYGPMLQPEAGSRVSQQQISATGGISFEASDWNILGAVKLLTLPPAIVWLPSLSFQWQHRFFQWSLQVSRNHRFPTFNERYYLNYGNANLRPEQSWNLDFSTRLALSECSVSFSTFMSWIRNLILSVPKSPVEWQAQNIGKVLRYGVELSVKGSFGRSFHQLNFTFQRSRNQTPGSPHYGKQLSYTPQWLFRYLLSITIDPFQVGSILEGTGTRYALPSNLRQSRLPPYWIWNLYLRYWIPSLGTEVRFECQNCTNTRYAVIWHYPMPGRWFRLLLRQQW